jgi:hypothetical protein
MPRSRAVYERSGRQVFWGTRPEACRDVVRGSSQAFYYIGAPQEGRRNERTNNDFEVTYDAVFHASSCDT